MFTASETPSELGPSGRELWERTTDDYDLAAHELAMLLQACRIADRLDRIAEQLATADLTHVNRHGEIVRNPLLAEARSSSTAFAQLLHGLRIPYDDDQVPQRRAGVRGYYAPRQVA